MNDYPKCSEHPSQTLFPSKFAEGHWWHYIDRAKSKESCEWVMDSAGNLTKFVKASPTPLPTPKVAVTSPSEPTGGGERPSEGLELLREIHAMTKNIEWAVKQILANSENISDKENEEIGDKLN